MTSVVAGPVRVGARLDPSLSCWSWLVKWLLVLPRVIVLVGLWVAFVVLSVVARPGGWGSWPCTPGGT